MAAPKGNKNALGNSGGRAPTAKEHEWHRTIWEQDSLVRELEAKIATGKYSVRDVYLLRALKADVSILKNLADKVLATLIDHTTNGKDIPQPILGYVSSNNGNSKNNGDEQTDTSNTGWNERLENSVNRPILDSPGAK